MTGRNRIPLDVLDPGTEDPGYWDRFHGAVMARAEDELARRRAGGRLTVTEVVFGWRRALVPVALMAAALSGLLLARDRTGEEPPSLAIEEALTGDMDGPPIPVRLAGADDVEGAALLVSVGGY